VQRIAAYRFMRLCRAVLCRVVQSLLYNVIHSKSVHCPLTPLQVFLDETPISEKDLEKMEKGEESMLASSLAWLAQRVQLAWVSLSTSDLLDTENASTGTTTSFTTLTAHLHQHCSSYRVRPLGLTMRNSANIAAAADPDLVQGYSSGSGSGIASVLPPGRRSTVPGSRPYCVRTRWGNEPDYPAIQRSLRHALDHLVPHTSPSSHTSHTAILCGSRIRPRQVAAAIPSAILYDGGVEKYDQWSRPTRLASSERCDQRPGLERWLTTGGLLVTHKRMFRGMEAASVVFVSCCLGFDGGLRSALMRAVGCLVIVADSRNAKQDKIGETFEVVNI